jgi:hypothetical protein
MPPNGWRRFWLQRPQHAVDADLTAPPPLDSFFTKRFTYQCRITCERRFLLLYDHRTYNYHYQRSMLSTYQIEEDSIQHAIDSLQRKKRTNIASLARQIGVTESKLRNRLQGRPSKLSNSNARTWLTSEQENALCITFDRLEQSGLHARVPMLTSISNSLLRQRYPSTTAQPRASYTVI